MYRYLVALCSLLLLCSRTGLSQVTTEDKPACRGVFDFIFVVDSSSSLRNEYSTEVIPFIINVSKNFVNPDFRLSLITFAVDASVHLPLTPISDRTKIQEGIDSLANVEPGGGTFLSPGLLEANKQIEEFGGDAASVILVLTDGVVDDIDGSVTQADHARSHDARVFAIGVRGAKEDQIVDDRDQFFYGGDFEYLHTVIEKVINETCIEISSVEPSLICLDDVKEEVVKEITLKGRGFSHQLDQDKAVCRFLTVDKRYLLTRPTEQVKSDRIVCDLPALNLTGDVLLQVSLNGRTFISSNVTLHIHPCDGGGGGGGGNPGGIIAGVIIAVLFVLILGVCLFWFLFPLVAGIRIVGGLPPEPKEEEPQPKPPRKWETVDASYYGGGGVGGIHAVTVKWGNAGATEEGSKLTKAKDANVLAVHEEAGDPLPPPRPELTCWGRFKKKLRRMYAVASSYRPVRTEAKPILCCPGPDLFSPNRAKTAPVSAINPTTTGYKQSGKSTSSISRPPPPPPPPSRPPRPPPPPPASTRLNSTNMEAIV